MKHLHLAPSWRTVGPIDVSQVSQFTPEEQRVELLNLDEHYYGDMTRKIGGEIHDTWPFDVAQLADVTMSDFLRKRGASEEAIRYMLLGFEDDAALDFIRDAVNHHDLSKIKGGNDQLPRAFALRLSDQVRYCCAVEQMDRSGQRVRIAYRRVTPHSPRHVLLEFALRRFLRFSVPETAG
jgi:hypothetical protein